MASYVGAATGAAACVVGIEAAIVAAIDVAMVSLQLRDRLEEGTRLEGVLCH